MKSSEKSTQKAILDYLTLRRVFHWRNNTGAFASEYKGKRSFVRFGTPGSPDIFAIKDSRPIGIECKDKSAKLNENQERFKEGFEKAGGLYIVARSIEDVQAQGL